MASRTAAFLPHFPAFVLPLFGDRKPKPFLQTEFNEKQGRFSPDGRWMAYSSDESGEYEVYVQPFPAAGGKWQISTGGGEQPSWRRDGKELFYLANDKKPTAVQVEAPAPAFRASAARELFQVHVLSDLYTRNQYAVTGDGQRFLVNTLIGEASPSQITVVSNWGHWVEAAGAQMGHETPDRAHGESPG